METIIKRRCGRRAAFAVLLAGALCGLDAAGAATLTYQQAMDIALKRSSRSGIIQGNLEVAERQYFARRVNFYFPEISLRGSVPAYERREEYGYLPGATTKGSIQSTTFDMDSYINLDQNLVTGGNLTLRAHLQRNDWDYPEAEGMVNEIRENGSFDLTFSQPILQPSQAKHDLNNTRDDLEIARLARQEETATLKQEVAEAYIGALELTLDRRIAEEKFESARLQADIDSSKFVDGVMSEEGWLESASARLDAELVSFDAQSEEVKKLQDLAILLELETTDGLELDVPEVTDSLSRVEQERLVAAADASIPIRKAEYTYNKAKRAADFEKASSGVQGTLSANYVKDLGNIDKTSPEWTTQDDLNTDTWGVTLDFTYPLWDGGASGSSVRAKEIEAQKAKIELDRARKAARAEVHALANSVDVGSRKLAVLKKQIELTADRLRIAQARFENGEISRITYLQSSVTYLEAQKAYLTELKNYLVDMYTLEGKFTG